MTAGNTHEKRINRYYAHSWYTWSMYRDHPCMHFSLSPSWKKRTHDVVIETSRRLLHMLGVDHIVVHVLHSWKETLGSGSMWLQLVHIPCNRLA